MTGGLEDGAHGGDDDDRTDTGRVLTAVSEAAARWPETPGLHALAEDAVGAALWACSIDPDAVSVSLFFATDAEIAELNARFRDKVGPTNVLSWPALTLDAPLDAEDAAALARRRGPGDARLFLGDVALAEETVAREAASAEKAFETHVAHLIAHGVLHLLGHDHQNEAEATAMEARERAAATRLGAPDPYPADLNDPAEPPLRPATG